MSKRARVVCHVAHDHVLDDDDDVAADLLAHGITCRANASHFHCALHADLLCKVDVFNDDDGNVFSCCPVCTRSCHCDKCLESRHETRAASWNASKRLVFLGPLGAKRDRRLDNSDSSSSNNESTSAQAGSAARAREPVRVARCDFSAEIFERVVIDQRRALIVTGMLDAGGLDRALWDLPQRVAQRGDACPADARMSLRVQGVCDRDVSAFRVLGDLHDVAPAWFLRQVLDGGRRADAFSDEYRDAPTNGRCVLYAKDWQYDRYEPAWMADLMRALPERVRPRNPLDVLGGLEPDVLELQTGYMGAHGSRTPLHIDKACTIAFNCVAWAETPATSKRWWLFHPDDSRAVDEAIRRCVPGGRLHDDSHWVDLEALAARADLVHGLTTFEQRAGDMVIVPPRAPHCVMNQGGLSFAVAANVLDATVVLEALDVERHNRTAGVKTVYKVKGAVWGTMRLQTGQGAVMPAVFEACTQILAEETRAHAACEPQMAAVSARELQLARAYMNRVVCDECRADIFNGYAVHGPQTYCMSGCAEVAYARHGGALRLCMPVSLAVLRGDLDRARALAK